MTAGVLASAVARPLPAIGRLRRPPLLGLAAFALYLGLGAYLAFVLHAYDRDAYSRIGNAYYVLFSRDPHLGAIGFVWMPLPSLFELALMPFSRIAPALVTHGFSAVIMSATFMALAVVTMARLLAELGVGRGARVVLTVAFALHPMVVYYAAIGTSEAPSIFFALFACLHLARYARTGSVTALVGVGVGLAGGYLTRYEAAAGAFGVAGFIGLLALARRSGPRKTRLLHAASESVIALMPFIIVFVAWAVASWIIVGSPFAQFTSEYGNSSQMRVGGGGAETTLPPGPSALLVSLRLVALSVALPVAVGLMAWVVARRRNLQALAPVAVMGPMLLFMVVTYVVHLTAPWLRYYILAIPLAIVMIGSAIAAFQEPAATPHPAREAGWGALPRRVLPATLLALVLASVPIAAVSMIQPRIGNEESRDIPPLLGPNAAAPDRPGNQIQSFAGELAIARYLDALDLPRGSVLVDAFLGFPIILQSGNPQQFVITADRDFLPALADPPTFGVRYVLAPPGAGHASLDAVNRTYPNLDQMSDFAVPVEIFPALGPSPSWGLYRFVDAGQ
jgi:hypothetical protein